MTGDIYGKRLQGRPKTRWFDNIKELTGMSMHQAVRLAQDRVKWKDAIHNATVIRTILIICNFMMIMNTLISLL